MPELIWKGKEQVINHHLDVPVCTLDRQYNYNSDGGSENKIIHGDNLEALKALLPQYEGRVKCIYIDPPYNTGNESWVYNDNVKDPRIVKWLGDVVGKEGEDLCRHDKWLCMMYPRLQLLKRLLADDGVIFVSIDDNEQANLRGMMDDMNVEQINDCLEREYSYRDKIKAKIRALATSHGEMVFYQWLDADKIKVMESYTLPESIHPVETAPAIPASLYEKEGKVNGWEAKVINEIANLENVLFWHKIVEKKGFCINGFINHYPDFLIQTKSGKTLIVETNGDDRDNSDSLRKLKLGEAWASKVGNDFRYFMVFDNNSMEGAYRLDDFLSVIRSL